MVQFAHKIDGMGKKKPAPAPAKKRYKAIRIRDVVIAAVEQRATYLAQDPTQYVNEAVRMRLEAEGCWPPPPPKAK